MAEVIRMPKMSDTMEEGVIASWLKKVGDTVKSGDILAEVETDKATMELESYEDGTLLYIGVKEKEAAPVDGIIAIIGKKGENIDGLLKDVKSGAAGNGAAEKAAESAAPAPVASAPAEKIDTSGIKATVVTMPKMSDTMTEGVIASWLSKVGDTVKAGDIIAEVETDKATMELESYEDGTLLYIGVEAGSSVPVDGVIAIIGEKGADYKTLLKAHEAGAGSAPAEESAPQAASAPASTSSAPAASSQAATADHSSDNGRIKISPLAKKMAEDKGYDIRQIAGSGDGGRIVRKDVESFSPSAQPSAPAAAPGKEAPKVVLPSIVGEESFEDVPVSQMRKVIAKGVSDSKFTAPHFYVTMEINMDKAIEARTSLNDISPVKISFNDMVVKAAAAALRLHPDVNVSWRGDKIRMNKHIHVAVAMAIPPDGLLMPVVRFADNKSLSHISAEIKEFGQKAKAKKLQPTDWEGATFSISNLGMFGVDEFTAILNAPASCILAVGGIKETAIVKNGQLVPGNIMKVTLTCDHRSVDGAMGAAFLQTLKKFLEDPIKLLV
ncbi:pyruvate dehydrogenase complex dihydrolipoamide acetyltransferase [Imperialibacter roseus]|uniref:Acetyltransferase component of pyruvate dehydrogenase complex n=1 Tax=Imperialibacter roseus TaxID=1324217 RepID=A0ABZ0IJ89_9BACT|nr:pyruvate dehydrogenase complex dihydrolipoamide acetyltransferase [Imperialibacter roseus]WOK04756.1 pyruvate dehydrogenase complex dihydrolipoamide acetyltransferase [Imperialibacter roseus]